MAGNGYELPENTMEYRLYPRLPPKLAKSDVLQFLIEQIDAYHAHLSKYLVPYIWQNEPFRLKTYSETSEPHVFGRTNYGDNVEDEWFIIYLMYQLTLAFSGLVAKVGDTDGEILLIEAAHSLPRGLNPETAENRVFISCGKVHIVPHPMNEREAAVLPRGRATLEQAIDAVRNCPRLTTADTAVQNDVANRIQGYPSKLAENIHNTHAYIPAPLAAVLSHSPHLISPIIQSFYHRDPIDLKCCVTMKHFRPGTRVMTEVRMTRCLYAQLTQQRFNPDKRSGWNIPATSNSNYKSYDLGMKLAHGAEILCSQCYSDSDSGPIEDLKQRSLRDPGWQRFLTTLTDKGYFKNEISGSRKHTLLTDDAKRYYYSTVQNNRTSSDKGEEVLKVLKTVKYDIETLRQQEKQLGSPDDDSWLDISPSQLDEMLASAAGRRADNMESFNMNTLADTMKSFMDNVSGVEGAEFPSTDNSRQGSEEPSEINFDTGASMIHSMQKMFEFDDEDSDSSTDMSEYSSDEDLAWGKKNIKTTPTKQPTKQPPKPAPRSAANKPAQARPGQTRPATNGTHHTNGAARQSADVGDYLGMDDYMKHMDKELATTNVGKSFIREERKKQESSRTYSSGYKKSTRPASTMSVDIDDLDDDFTPVNVDMNLVKNMMQSMDSQQGEAGPTTNIVTGMGVNPPRRPPRK